jgi:hypothetical protein
VGYGIHFSLSLFGSDSGLQPSNDAEQMILTIALVRSAERERHPHLSVRSRKLKVGRGDAHRRVGLAIERQSRANDFGVRWEVAAPIKAL